MIDKKVLDYSEKLKKIGIGHEIVEHPELKTPPETLGYLGLTFSDGSSTLIMKANDEFIAVIRRDDCKLDFEKLKKAVGVKSVRMATPDEFKQVTGLPLGAARVYNPELKTFIDKKILEREYVIGGTGSFTCSIKYKVSDLQKIPNATVIDATEVIKSSSGDTSSHEKIAKLKEKLEKAEIKHSFIQLSENLPLDVASHVAFHGISMQQAVPTLIYRTEKGLIAVQKRGDTKVNAQKLKELVGIKRLSLASPDELKELGMEPGIVALAGLRIPHFIDKRVLENNEIYGGTGVKTFAIKVHAKDLPEINNATVGDFAESDSYKKRILTGDTPTGKLHLGHCVGTLENRVKLQNDYETFIILADTHALTTLHANPLIIREHTLSVLLDNLAVGLDPEKVTFFAESEIPELYELAALFSMYVSHNRALRNPTIKDEIKMKGLSDQFSLGFINYPVFQAADILCVKGELVPVGQDQEAHLEQSREIARVFNKMANKQIFPEPKALIGRVGKLIGTDGNPKMSKSIGNTIYLSETAEEVEKKVMNMYTDPTRLKATDPGHVEGNPVFAYLDAFSTDEDKGQIATYKESYTKGQVGDVEVKKFLVKVLNNFLEPIRKRRQQYDNEQKLLEILRKGNRKVRDESQKTLTEVKQALGFVY